MVSQGKKFIQYLKENKEIDCELIIGNCDMPATFVWDDSYVITKEGYEEFKAIMDADYILLPNGNIEILCDSWRLGERFAMAIAGYVGESQFDLWFYGTWAEVEGLQ